MFANGHYLLRARVFIACLDSIHLRKLARATRLAPMNGRGKHLFIDYV